MFVSLLQSAQLTQMQEEIEFYKNKYNERQTYITMLEQEVLGPFPRRRVRAACTRARSAGPLRKDGGIPKDLRFGQH